MKQEKRILWNVCTNYGRQIILIAVALILNPFLFHRLGEDGYGVIALVGMTGGLLMLLDAGLAHAIARFVSKHDTKNDTDEINRVVTTSVAVYTLTGVIAFLTVATMGMFFLEPLGVPVSVIDEARSVFLVVACALAIRFPGNAFEGVLRGLQRFDLSNTAMLIERIAYATLSFLVLGLFDLGILAIACSLLVGAVASQAVRIIAAHRVYPQLSIRWKWLSWRVFREMFSFGTMAFLTQISSFLENAAARAIISAALGSTLLGSFNLVMLLAGLLRQTRVSATNVVMPVASKYETLENTAKLQQLLNDGSRLLLAIIFPIGIWIAVMSESILLTWIGPALRDAALLLSLLAVVEMLDASNGVGHMVLLGMGRAKFLGIAYAISSILAICILTILVFHTNLGLYSAPIGLGAGVIVRRSFLLVHMCRCVQIPVSRYLSQVLLPTAGITLVVGAAALLTRMVFPLGGWSLLILSASVAAVAHILAAWIFVLRDSEKKRLAPYLRRTKEWLATYLRRTFARVFLNRDKQA